MKFLISAILIAASVNVFSTTNQPLYITIGSDAIGSGKKSFADFEVISDNGEIAVVKTNSNNVDALSEIMHHDHFRCGGFMQHESLEEALEALDSKDADQAKSFLFADYSIDQEDRVVDYIAQVDEFSIRSTIEKLSSFHNRYYKAETGQESQAYVKSKWEELSIGRSDVTVEYFNHSRWPQPSVIMTIEGSSMKDEVVVIGGHADSIAGWWGQSSARAPGADDNASGIATITEVIRVAMENGFKPERTVKFMAYAAEEVGLLGSKEIAADFKHKNVNVIGVMQLDMTNFKGDRDKDIVFMSDYTNTAQNEFLAKLIDTYVRLPWGYSQCGYACSDHASWHGQGYPASIPFESTMGSMNRKIHTDKDTISESGGTADHAVKFAKLALAYMIEIAN